MTIRKIRNAVIAVNGVVLSTLSAGDSITLKGPQGSKPFTNKDVYVIKGAGAKEGTVRVQRMEEGASGKNVPETTVVHAVESIVFEEAQGEEAPLVPDGIVHEAANEPTDTEQTEGTRAASYEQQSFTLG